MKTLLLSNINCSTLTKKIKKSQVILPDGYNTWIQELLSTDGFILSYNPDIICIILDGKELFKNCFTNFKQQMDEYMNIIENAVSNYSNIDFFISSIDVQDYILEPNKGNYIEYDIEYEWFIRLRTIINKYANSYIFNLKNIVSIMGKKEFYSDKMWYLASSKFSIKSEVSISSEIDKMISTFDSNRKKCIIVDLDNTLWGGVIGEDGINNIVLSTYKEGSRFRDFQEQLKYIKDMGIILCICSKNNYEDAMKAFEHPYMYLKKEDFTIIKANWEQKSINIRNIARELNIGLDAIIFIDDNPIERECVKSDLPDVEVPNFPKDTSELKLWAKELFNKYFYKLKLSDEDTVKTEQYKQNLQRQEYKNSLNNIDDFYIGLGIKIKLKSAQEEDLNRINQLVHKTNQFNLTTKRYSEQQLLNLINSKEYNFYIANIEDRFGDNGQCVIIIIKFINDKVVNIETFLMSCRVMGRKIETELLNYIEYKLSIQGIEKIYAEYIPSLKNTPVKHLYNDHGYVVTEKLQDGTCKYEKVIKKTDKYIKYYAEVEEI